MAGAGPVDLDRQLAEQCPDRQFGQNGGTVGSNVIAGNDGNDVLYDHAQDFAVGYGDADLLQGGNGNDTIVAFAGRDTLDGGAGDDSLVVGSASVAPNTYWTPAVLFGVGAGRDRLTSYHPNVSVCPCDRCCARRPHCLRGWVPR